MIDYQQIIDEFIVELASDYRVEDTILYALGIGFSADPCDPKQLRFTYEEDLQTLPAMCMAVGYPGFWMRDPKWQIEWQKVLHAEEHFIIHAPLPTAGSVIGRTCVDNIVDRGADKGAFVYLRKELVEKSSGRVFATVNSTTLCRGDGGFGGPAGPRSAPVTIPERTPDIACELDTLPRQALLYRLSGDMNPLHADPNVAGAAGFERPILHGRCTMGVAHHALLRCCCDYDTSRFKSMRVRFSAPVYPGETLLTEIWQEGTDVYFITKAKQRDVVVLNNGHAEII